MHTPMHTHIHKQMHTYTHTHMHIDTCSYTCTYTTHYRPVGHSLACRSYFSKEWHIPIGHFNGASVK